jgi:uncharacterized protein
MQRLIDPAALSEAHIDAACAQACRAIAPAWPLDRSIAVNPHWSRIDMPVRQVAARMAVLGAIQVFPPRGQQRQAFDSGRIVIDDLYEVLATLPLARAAGLDAAACLAALNNDRTIPPLPLLIDLLESELQRDARLGWRHAITHQVSQACAAYFDERQADWQPERSAGLYAFWRDTLLHDHGIGALMGLPELGRALSTLPATPQEAERWVLERLGLPQPVWADYLEAVLLTVNGWASYCAYLGWQARLDGGADTHLRELLAIRLAWGVILLNCIDNGTATRTITALRAAWQAAPQRIEQAAHDLMVDEVWQTALEVGYQRTLATQLTRAAGVQQDAVDIEAQAAFCIDVRSEPLRRALEEANPAIRTIGFAGFFGLPIAYTPLASKARRPQLPGLLAPAMEVTDRIQAPGGDDAALSEGARQSRQNHVARAAQWDAGSRWPGAAFSLVEAAGIGYLGKLAQWLRPPAKARARDDLAGLPTRYRALCRPHIVGLDTQAKVTLASGILHAMGLGRDIAPLVVLVGHGSQSANNAHAAGLDCGACCGQTGEVNARSLARLLNESAVRDGLRAEGLPIPPETSFVAALHNTTTDEIEAFDLDLLPSAAQARWRRLAQAFARASAQVRRARAPSLRIDAHAPDATLLATLRRRANDGAQTRPEWGLAGNAAFVIAPRSRTRGADLAGRSFLQDYDASLDPDGSLLELLMTAPMLVAHWINWQYHASRCDPLRLGSGNKLLHNVVGGQIGVFEGNGGDLRIGLARQSLHDGHDWMHEPLRLTVVIDAPAKAIEQVIHKHDVVRQLVEHGWLHLWRFGLSGLQRYQHADWRNIDMPQSG